MKVQKGQKIKITNNEILTIMGVEVATGVVQSLHSNDGGFNFKCDQTNAIEGVDYGDGQLEILN